MEFIFYNKICSIQPISVLLKVFSSFFYPRNKTQLEIENKILVLLRGETKQPKRTGFHPESYCFQSDYLVHELYLEVGSI